MNLPPSDPDAQPKPYQVLDYSWDTLVGLFANAPPNSEKWDYVSDKRQILYIDRYLRDLKVQCLVFERRYTDKFYSDDYNGYYVRCFNRYEKTCSRIHAFVSPFDEKRVADIFKPGSKTDLQSLGYRGFIVVKPLPETVVGRTCLSPPSRFAKPAPGYFISGLETKPNLFGADLSVNSLPCQEQDHEVAACATTAVWSVLQGTSELFSNPIMMPLEITRLGNEKSGHQRTVFPNDGLAMSQICDVVRGVGLEPVVSVPLTKKLFAAEANAYLRAGIPLIFGLDLNTAPKSHPTPRELHAVALSGVGEPTGDIELLAGDGTQSLNFRLRGTRIDEVFAHDDGVGPYAPIDLSSEDELITTSWLDRNGYRRKAEPLELLIPLHRQIRVRFHDILRGIAKFDCLMKDTDRSLGLEIFKEFEWDIVLSTPRRFKREIAAADIFSDKVRSELLTAGFPRFMWKVVAYNKNKMSAIFLFDATDLRQGAHLIDIFYADDNARFVLNSYVLGLQRLGKMKAPRITKSILRYLQTQAHAAIDSEAAAS